MGANNGKPKPLSFPGHMKTEEKTPTMHHLYQVRLSPVKPRPSMATTGPANGTTACLPPPNQRLCQNRFPPDHLRLHDRSGWATDHSSNSLATLRPAGRTCRRANCCTGTNIRAAITPCRPKRSTYAVSASNNGWKLASLRSISGPHKNSSVFAPYLHTQPGFKFLFK